MTRHFIDIADFSAAEVTAMLDLADVPLADLVTAAREAKAQR